MSRRLRTLSTVRLTFLVVLGMTAAAVAAAIALAATRSNSTPPALPTAQAIHDALAAEPAAGITAHVTFTNNLFPTGGQLGNTGSALMSGATGRLWATNDGRGRLELQSNAGDTQIVWNRSQITAYDASSNTAYELALPKPATDGGQSSGPATLAEITTLLPKLGDHATLSTAQPTSVAGQAAYSVSVSPKENGGLVGMVELAWAAAHGTPLRIAVYAKGETSPTLELSVDDISYGAVSSTDVDIAPPAGARVVELTAPGDPNAGAGAKPVTGLSAVQAAAGFPVTAPDSLDGQARSDVRLVGGKAALIAYGHGLGSIIVIERKADATGGSSAMPGSLPTVTVNGATAHELATPLGTVVEWQANGVSYVVAGSVTQPVAETAARALS